jgi:hypothetical protein
MTPMVRRVSSFSSMDFEGPILRRGGLGPQPHAFGKPAPWAPDPPPPSFVIFVN